MRRDRQDWLVWVILGRLGRLDLAVILGRLDRWVRRVLLDRLGHPSFS